MTASLATILKSAAKYAYPVTTPAAAALQFRIAQTVVLPTSGLCLALHAPARMGTTMTGFLLHASLANTRAKPAPAESAACYVMPLRCAVFLP